MSDRGDYSPIARVLRDGPDFQRLSPIARHVFYDLKIGFPASGIAVYYREAMIAELSQTTGWEGNLVRDALDELEAAEWIQRQANIVWIIDHLKHHPNLNPVKDPKHRKGIQNVVRGLPRLPIVALFIDHYPEYFTDAPNIRGEFASSVLSPQPSRALEGPNKDLGSKKKEKNKNKEKDIPPAGADGTQVPDSWPARLATGWSEEVGPVTAGRVGAALKPAVDRHGAERVERAMRAYIAVQKADGKTPKFSWFVEQSQVWIERTANALGVVDGEMSDTLELLTRPAKGAA